MAVVIFEGVDAPEEEEQEAENLANLIEDKSKHKAEVTNVPLSFDPSAFDGVVVVGGQIANLAYSKLIDLNFVNQVTQSNTKTLKVGEVDGTATMAVAGWAQGQTKELVNEAVVGGELDQFISMLPEKEDDEETTDPQNPSTDPDDPLIEDPPEEDEIKTPHEIRVRPPSELEGVILADYQIEFTDLAKGKKDLEDDDQAVGSAISGQIGASLGTDEDVFEFAGKIESVQSDRDIILIINGEEYQYDSDIDKIGKPSDILGQIGGTEEADRIVESLRKKPEDDSEGDGGTLQTIADNALFIGAGIVLLYFLTSGSGRTVVVRE